MGLNDRQITELLVKENYLTAEDLAKSAATAAARHTSLVDQLVTDGLITTALLGQAIAESFGVPFSDLASRPPDRELVGLIPEAISRKERMVVASRAADHLVVASDNPKNPAIATSLASIFPGQKISLTYARPEAIEAAFIHYRTALQTRFGEILKNTAQVAPELLDEILSDAVAYRASDIHFEPQENEVIIRFRIDGVLYEAGRLPKTHYANVLNRIKVQARLRIDEHTRAQDGAIGYRQGAVSADLRVSIVPTLDGETVVIRLLARYVGSLSLTELGLSDRDRTTVMTAVRRPFGMIVVAGPTGSGKTTSLYAVLRLVNRPEINITTIEDPVEYKLAGINQIQVNPETDLTFEQGLRSIARQDPDVILVGEIRDTETAEIAVNAALTGHLLLTTFHANDAATAIPRLLDMGVEPYLLASTLELLIAQRLVRRICESCRYSYQSSSAELTSLLPGAERFFGKSAITLYRGKGCSTCQGTGYRNRLAIFELITMSAELKALSLHNPPTAEIWKLARAQGSRTLFEDGVEKVKSGLTTVEELLRVANPPPSD